MPGRRGCIFPCRVRKRARLRPAFFMADTDCRSEEGITVGLVDALITLLRILRHRDLSPEAVQEALADLAADEDLLYLIEVIWPNKLDYRRY